MKTAVALLALVVVAGLVDCSPSLREKLLQMQEEATRGRGGKGGKGGQEPHCEETDWPYGWIELVSLVAKCEAGISFLNYSQIDPALAQGVLVQACPPILNEVSKMEKDMDEETIKMITGHLRQAFPLLQCVNLQADKESLLFWSKQIGASTKCFEDASNELFELCKSVFDSVSKMEEEVEKDVKDAEQEVADSTKRQLLNTLRELISYAKRR